MEQIIVKYNPYKMETNIFVNGKEILNDSGLYKVVRGKRLQEWIGSFPQMLIDELNTVSFDIEFHGMPLDWDDFQDVFERAEKAGKIKSLRLKFVEGKSDEAINQKIVDVFTDLQEGPIDDFRDAKLTKAFASINNSVFPINVIATMSSGKSTLINALLGSKLMPSKNEACTATITEILDNDGTGFSAVAYDENDNVVENIPELTYEEMSRLNDNKDIYRIAVNGNIPFLDADSTALMLVDTPGPNNSQNQAHKNTTYRAINNDANNLILYVLNGTQLSTNDDATLLNYVADQIKKGGKQVRDRFLFVVNKMDGFNPEEENIENAINKVRMYLASYGIEDPQIFPCSAFMALNIRTHLAGINNIDELTRAEERALPSAARDTLPMIDKFNDNKAMYLERYSTLSPSAQRELDYRLSQAENRKDTKETALIHSGIYSIEAAIRAYVKKYAGTKKVKDLVESFQEVLESTQVLVKAKTRVATDEKAAKACAERAAEVRKKIDDGKEAQAFKERIAQLNPMEKLSDKADVLKAEASRKTGRVFEPYGDVITDRNEAKRLVNQFSMMSSDYIAELTAELESTINKEVMETGEKILGEYQEKLSRIDGDNADRQLDFDTVDLIKGALNNMRETAQTWCSDDFADETVGDVGEVTYEDKVYYDKVGQEEERVACGTEQVKVGTKKVKVGSHEEYVGTKTVRNPKKRWWKIFTPKYIEVDDYETVDDYEEQDVFETQIKYQTVIRDIFEERVEKIEKFSVETSVIQSGLISKMRRNLDDGIEAALNYAQEQIEAMKKQFTEIFDELDVLIKEKYTELEQCATDQKTKEEELNKNKRLLEWIEGCKKEIEDILNIF